MNRAPSVAYEGDGAAADASADGAPLVGAVDGVVVDGAADDGEDDALPPEHAAMNAAMLVKPVAARNRRRVTGFADTRRTMASIS
jgi:hypothetical protein